MKREKKIRYGYGRVSSKGKKLYGMSLEEQTDSLAAQGLPFENIYLDACTGTTMYRPEFDRVLSLLNDGDELVVCKLDRFARTALEGAMLVRELVKRGVRVNILNMGVADNTPMGKACKRERDPEWREGRKPIQVDEVALEKCRQKQKGGTMNVSECYRELGISRSTWYNLTRKAG